MELVRAGMEDLDELVATRLRALADAPYAFASSLERERAFTRADWVRRLETGVWFLARLADPAPDTVGMVAGVVDREDPFKRQLVGMWVAPSSRGGPVGAALVRAVLDWAAGEGSPAVVLWVVETNVRARRLYERLGFTPTGGRQPVPARPEVKEIQMLRPVPADDL